MGLNNENARRLVFDIETAPLPEAVDYLEPVDAPANYKDPLKIEAYKAEKQAENLDRCGLDVDLCRVVAIGYWGETASEPHADVVSDIDEAELLARFWTVAQDKHLVGFNCLGFDLPVLQRRSIYLGVPMPRIQVDRYRHPGVTDLAQLLSYNGALKMRGLSFYAKRFGFETLPDTLTGADIAQAVAEDRWDDIVAHVTADVQKTALLAAKLGFFSHVTAGAF